MAHATRYLSVCLVILLRCCWAIYVPVREYSGETFFSTFNYWSNIDNTTWGNVTYVNQSSGVSQNLTYIDPNTGHAIIRVDNTTYIPTAPVVNRNSVKITTQDAYPIGSLVTIDVSHIPYGCSVWPSLWMLGTNMPWPNCGEIDIIEAINNLGLNQYALHTTPGCDLATNSAQTGVTLETDCSTAQGCLVQETKPNSFGSGFAQAGGGVFALQFDVSGIFFWFWQRSDIPTSISQANSSSNMDLSDWGTPSAAYPSSSCDIAQYFQPQQLVIDITLCGIWAGVTSIYDSTGCSGQCAQESSLGNAYWDISYIRTYIATAFPSSTATNGTDDGSGSTTSISIGSPASSDKSTAHANTGTVPNIAEISIIVLLSTLLALV